jgi:hypothetical protein
LFVHIAPLGGHRKESSQMGMFGQVVVLLAFSLRKYYQYSGQEMEN